MNDEKFELTISDLAGSGTYYADIADELRARDTAPREALARVEAERDTAIVQMQNIRKQRDAINKKLGDAEFNLCIAQQQLAEAVGLLKSISVSLDNGGCDLGKVWARVEALLSSHAQAEQQEAQGAQAGDDIAHMQAVMKGADDDLDCARRLHAAGYRRAALATQPAKWVDPVLLSSAGPVYDQGFADGVAEAKRLNAVRGADHD